MEPCLPHKYSFLFSMILAFSFSGVVYGGCPEKDRAEDLARVLLSKDDYGGSEYPKPGECMNGYLQYYPKWAQCLLELEAHAGIDIRGNIGMTIHSPVNGILKKACDGPFSETVIELSNAKTDDGKPLYFVLLHSDSCIAKTIGSKITAGNPIAKVGKVGLGENGSPHMHIEIRPESFACCDKSEHPNKSNPPSDCNPAIASWMTHTKLQTKEVTENPLKYLPEAPDPPDTDPPDVAPHPIISFVRDENKGLDVGKIDTDGLVIEGTGFGQEEGTVTAATSLAEERPEYSNCLINRVYSWAPEIEIWSDTRIQVKPFPENVPPCAGFDEDNLQLKALGLEYPILFTVTHKDGITKSQAFPFPFRDIASDPSYDNQDWYSTWVTRAWSLGTGIVRGFGEHGDSKSAANLFRPGQNVNQAEALKMIVETVADAEDISQTCPEMEEADPQTNQKWVHPYWCYALKEGWFQMGDLEPAMPAERGQIARWLVSAKGLELSAPPEQEFTDLPLQDPGSSLDEIVQVAHQLNRYGIIEGKKSLCTREVVSGIDPCEDFVQCTKSCDKFEDCPCFCQCDYLVRAEAAKIVWTSVKNNKPKD